MIPNLIAPSRRQLPIAAAYAASVALVTAATLASMEMPSLLEPMRFLFFWGAVLVATLIGGRGPGLVAVASSVLAAFLTEFPGRDIVEGKDPDDVLRLAIYAVWASVICIAVSLRDAANRRADLLREWLGTTLHSIGDGVIVTDSSGKVVYLNPVATALTGWPLESATGRAIGEIFVIRNEETLEPMENPATRAIETGEVVLLDNHTVLVTPSGKAVPIDDSAAPIRDSRGTLRGVVLVFRDVTRRRAAEKALVQADSAKDQFLATLSHDLRTPLTAILGWTHLLQQGRLDEASEAEALVTIEQSAAAQAALIEDILDVTRIASGKIILDRSPVDLVEIVREAAHSLQPSMSAKRISLDLELPAERLIVSGDPKRLRQIVWNLLSNAIKFSEEEGSIEVHALNGDSVVELKVIDYGLGIDPDALPRVFERFGQAHGDHSRRLGGLGLGLAIVRDLAELHGGVVTARSAGLGQGATFTVRLPLIESELPAAETPAVQKA